MASNMDGAALLACAARATNEALRSELDRLKVRNAELEGRALEADRLAGLLTFRNAHSEAPMLAARVIGAGVRTPEAWS